MCIDKKDQEENKSNEDDQGNIYLTKEEFKIIMKNFEEEINNFDRLTKENSSKLKKLEIKIKDLPEKMDKINNFITKIIKENYYECKELRIDNKNKIDHLSKVIIILFIFEVFIVIFLYFSK